MSTEYQPLITAYGTAKRAVIVTNKYRKLMVRRMHELDRYNSQELAVLLAEAKRIKESFRTDRPTL